jgi:hypothetical protein
MSFLDLRIHSPIETIQRRFTKKEAQIFQKGGLVPLDKEEVISSGGDDLLAHVFLRIEGVST